MKFWLQNGPIEIMKKMIHKVTGYPTQDKNKTMRYLSREEIEVNIGFEWNGQCLSITNIFNPLIEFAVRVIAHQFYHSSRLNSVSCMAINKSLKIVMKDHEYDLSKLQRLQLAEKLVSIRKEKNIMCEFGSLVMCIFFYTHKYFRGIDDIIWE